MVKERDSTSVQCVVLHSKIAESGFVQWCAFMQLLIGSSHNFISILKFCEYLPFHDHAVFTSFEFWSRVIVWKLRVVRSSWVVILVLFSCILNLVILSLVSQDLIFTTTDGCLGVRVDVEVDVDTVEVLEVGALTGTAWAASMASMSTWQCGCWLRNWWTTKRTSSLRFSFKNIND